MASDFARPAHQLADSGNQDTVAPTGGMGLVLDPAGLLPPSVHPPILTTWPAAAMPSAEILPGYEFYYVADSTNGVYWHFKYDPTQATYPWVFLGGQPLSAAVDTSETLVSATYAALATAGPSVALPRGGDYQIELGCHMRSSTATASAFMSYDIGGTGAIDGNAVEVDSAVASMGSHVWRRRRLTGFSAVTLTSKYRASAGTGTYKDRYLSALPIRLA